MDQRPPSGVLDVTRTPTPLLSGSTEPPITPFTEEDRYALNSVPQTSHVGVLTPGSSECGILGDKAFQGVIGASLVAR